LTQKNSKKKTLTHKIDINYSMSMMAALASEAEAKFVTAEEITVVSLILYTPYDSSFVILILKPKWKRSPSCFIIYTWSLIV